MTAAPARPHGEQPLLEEREAARAVAQQEFDQRVPQALRNRRGQFSTPPALAVSMLELARRLLGGGGPVRFLDPALGTGVFFYALRKVYSEAVISTALGFEIDRALASVSSQLWGPLGLEVRPRDFTLAPAPSRDQDKPNLIACNPPYVRHHHLDQHVKSRLKRSAHELGFAVNGLAGLYTYFLLLSDRWLARGGGAVWVVPAEFLDVNYGSELRRYLASTVTTHVIHRFSPEDVQFSDALVTSVVVVFSNSPPSPAHEVTFSWGSNLLRPAGSRHIPAAELLGRTKWGPLFRSAHAHGSKPAKYTLADLFHIKRGLATGANDFFILEESRARDLKLPRDFLRPILPSHRMIPSPIIQSEPDGFPRGLPRLVLLDCPLTPSEVSLRFPDLSAYLRLGEAKGLPARYLPRSRSPWYSQEDRPPAPILCTYMARRKTDGRAFRFFRNYSQATAGNVYLLLYPQAWLEAASRVDGSLLDRIFEYLQHAQGVEEAGRVYGGGLNKIEPSELGSLEVSEALIHAVRSVRLRL